MFSKMRNTIQQRWLLGVALMVVVVGSLFLVRFQSSAQEPEILQLSDLPEGFTSFSETQLFTMDDLNKDEEERENEGHFLDTANLKLRDYTSKERQQLSAYKSRQSFGAVGEAFDDVVVVMNFVYEYASPAEAATAVKILQNEFGKTMSAQPEISVKDSGLQGTRFELMEGSEGDSSYLFIGQRGNTLIVFFTNGFDVDAVASTYQMVLEKLSDR
jgi:hypothetical protein